MLSRLISLLRRIPAVKWAFTRLRPPPHSGSTNATPIAADEEPAIVADIVDGAPVLDSLTGQLHDEVDVAAPVAALDPDDSVIADSPAAAPSNICDSDDLSEEALPEIATAAVENTPVSSVDVEFAPVELPDPVIDDEPVSNFSVQTEAVVVEETLPVLISAEISAPVVVEAATDSHPAHGAATKSEPAPAPTSHVPKPANTAKARSKIVEPVDRSTLIRQRWAETGIRMWNPRLHGAGEATLNIQGSVELLPPEPGETMPRYDKLEFRMLGGLIVCEGVIVEPPLQAGQRSFTRLAEPRSADRTREPMRERQAALA